MPGPQWLNAPAHVILSWQVLDKVSSTKYETCEYATAAADLSSSQMQRQNTEPKHKTSSY